MSTDKHLLMIDAAKLYYQSDYTQQEIAKKLGISRPTVSRLLQQAKDLGYVRIEIVNPFEDMDILSEQLKKKYSLDTVIVSHTAINDNNEVKKSISQKAAEYLFQTIKDGDIIGVTWGTTMYHVAANLKEKNVKNVEVVQLNGGISYSKTNTYASEIIHLFAKAYHSVPRYLPLPVIFDSHVVKDVVESDRHIKQTIDRGKQANIAIFTVGTVKENAIVFRLGYLDEGEKIDLQQNAVGDICSRFFNKHGKVANKIINSRTVGIELDELRKKEKSILVAGGPSKIEAIHGALSGKYANVFITDQFTAKLLLG